LNSRKHADALALAPSSRYFSPPGSGTIFRTTKSSQRTRGLARPRNTHIGHGHSWSTLNNTEKPRRPLSIRRFRNSSPGRAHSQGHWGWLNSRVLTRPRVIVGTAVKSAATSCNTFSAQDTDRAIDFHPQDHHAAEFKYRWIVRRQHPRCSAISSILQPAARRRTASLGRSGVVGGGPPSAIRAART
jgi:hypothetical protein